MINIPVLISTLITEEVELVTNSSGSTVIFHDGYKYLKSGESKTTLQYRCCHYMKKCRSRIIFYQESQTVMKNEVAHNHEKDVDAYNSFIKTSMMIQRFGKNSSKSPYTVIYFYEVLKYFFNR